MRYKMSENDSEQFPLLCEQQKDFFLYRKKNLELI